MIYYIPLIKGTQPLMVMFQGKTSRTAENRVKKHLNRIKKFHSLPKDKVQVHFIPTRQLEKEGVKAKFDSSQKMFIVDPHATSFQHEFGHYIDRFVLGQDGKPWSESNVNYKRQFGFKKRPKNKNQVTQYFDPLRGVRGWYTKRSPDDMDTTNQYARSQPKEHFASAYNRMIGEQDGSEHYIPDTDVKKFKKMLKRKIKATDLEMGNELHDADVRWFEEEI